tara:strand:- start:1683 stop:3050 length:1368 start_codon:yes stop_codon:yes gene_type:complete
MNLGERQIELINRIKKYYLDLKSSNIDVASSGLCYFSSWVGESPGIGKLKLWNKGLLLLPKFIIILIKNILAISAHTNYIEFNNQNFSKNYHTLVITWCQKKDFKDDGSFYDRYFKENSEDLPNSYWFLISIDGYIPENLKKNIKILKRKEGIIKYNFFNFFKILINLFFDHKFSPRKIFHYLSFYSYFAKLISLKIKNELKKNNYKIVLLPYEAQPFQNSTFLEVKKINQKTLTIGYLSSLLTPFPSDFIHRSGAPDMLYVHGKSQIDILRSRLNWPKEKLFLIPSLRYRHNKKSLSNKIYLPLIVINKKKLIKEFENILINSSENSFVNLEVINHPLREESKKHLSMKMEIEKIMKNYKSKFSDISKNNNISIFFGVTAAIFEALEKGSKIIHISVDPLFETHSETIWPNLKVKQLSQNTFSYELINLNQYINFGENKKILYQILKNTTRLQI